MSRLGDHITSMQSDRPDESNLIDFEKWEDNDGSHISRKFIHSPNQISGSANPRRNNKTSFPLKCGGDSMHCHK
jgi:hypothetical protein